MRELEPRAGRCSEFWGLFVVVGILGMMMIMMVWTRVERLEGWAWFLNLERNGNPLPLFPSFIQSKNCFFDNSERSVQVQFFSFFFFFQVACVFFFPFFPLTFFFVFLITSDLARNLSLSIFFLSCSWLHGTRLLSNYHRNISRFFLFFTQIQFDAVFFLDFDFSCSYSLITYKALLSIPFS